MKNIVSNLKEHLSQGKQLNLEFLNNLYNKMKLQGNDVVDYQHLKAESVSPQCPNCKASISKKMGTSKASKCINVKIVVKTSEKLLAPSSIIFTKKN